MPLRRLVIAAATLLPLGAAALSVACTKPAITLLAGEAMGSAWTVKIAGPLPDEAALLRAGIQARFDAVEMALSTWRLDSQLSRFNDAPHGDWQALDPELFAVLAYALQLAQVSDGAYDVTIAPLVDLWGFGPDPKRDEAPTPAEIAAARARVGWHNVLLDVAGQRARKPPGVRVDLSSLGKGRGVDRVAEWLESRGVRNYLIDLSGKLRAGGRNATGEAWRVAVEKPEPDTPSGLPDLTEAVVQLEDEAIATAGDYRRYFDSNGRHLSHLIDPVSGQPIDHGTGSATARSADCMSADAWATLLTLVPPVRALQLADRHGIAALLVVRGAAGLQLVPSAAWTSAAAPTRVH